MTRAKAKTFHGSIALGLLACSAWPAIELLCHTNDSIFQTGQDTETTLALLFVLMGLAVSSLKLVVSFAFIPVFRLCSRAAERAFSLEAAPGIAVPTPSPPLPLRI